MTVLEDVMPKLSIRTEKPRRRGVMIEGSAAVLLCHNMTRRKKSVMILEMSFPKPGGHVLSPEFDRIRGGPRLEMGLKNIYIEEIHESALCTKFGLIARVSVP